LVGLSGAAAAVDGPVFTGIGDLPNDDVFASVGYGVSGDGNTVVGWSMSEAGWEAFRWTEEEGMVGLGDLEGGYFVSSAHDASYDGSVIVGRGASEFTSSGSATPNVGREAFRWTEEEGMVGLGDLPENPFASTAYGISGDGLVVVGAGNAVGNDELPGDAVRWTKEFGIEALGELPGGTQNSIARGVSADGSVIVGAAGTLPAISAFRWTEEIGMVPLVGESDDWLFGIYSAARAVSADGKVVVGWIFAPNDQTLQRRDAFRWTEEDGLVRLGDMPEETRSESMDVSEDGSVIVGFYSTELGRWAFIWNEHDGKQVLADVLTNDYGLDLTGWTLTTASAVSDDGFVIAGTGINPEGNTEGWVVCLREECFEDDDDDDHPGKHRHHDDDDDDDD
jgi:probable HAF family extracellular repeat protein